MISLPAVLVAVALAAAPPDVPPPASGPSGPAAQFPAEATVVVVDAVVLDKSGNAVRDLGPDDFVVKEDGAVQPVTSFREVDAAAVAEEVEAGPQAVSTNVETAREAGRTFAVVFDGTHLTPEGAQRAKAAVRRFLTQGVREGDSVALVSTAGGAWWTARGKRGRDRLLALLDRLRGGRIDALPPGVAISDSEAVRIVEYDDPVVAGAVYARLLKSGATIDPNAMSVASSSSQPPSSAAGSPGASLAEWYRFHPEVQQYASQLYQVVQARRRATLETLRRVLESLTTRGGRKSLLLVSEGFVADRRTPGFREAIEVARQANAAVYFFDARGLNAGGEDLMTGVGQLVGQDAVQGALLLQDRSDADAESVGAEGLADETGGFTVKNTNDLTKGFRRIERESVAYYLLGYHPANERRDGGYRRISVELKRPGLAVHARKGYFALPPEAAATDARKPAKPGTTSPLLQRALDAPFEVQSIPLRVAAYTLDLGKKDAASVLVATEVDIRRLGFERQKDRYEDRLGFVGVVVDLDSGRRFPVNETIALHLTQKSHDAYAQSWYPLVRDFQLPSGTYQAHVAVLDENSRRLGSVVHEFEVPALSGFRVSTPVLSDTLEAAKEGGMPRPAPLARRTFAAKGFLYCLFAVYGAAPGGAGHPEVASGFSLQSAGGREALHGDAAPMRPDSSGNLVRLTGIPLDGLAAGDYTLVLSFEDRVAGVRQERRERLKLTAEAPRTAP